MNWTEFYQYIKPIADRRSIEYQPMLDKVGWKWEREKFEREQQGGEASGVVSPFKYIEGRYSLYKGVFVYSIIRNAMEKEQRIIRIGPANVEVEARSNTSDHFSEYDEEMIPYFLEVVRLDEVLAEHLEMTKEQDILIITINTE